MIKERKFSQVYSVKYSIVFWLVLVFSIEVYSTRLQNKGLLDAVDSVDRYLGLADQNRGVNPELAISYSLNALNIAKKYDKENLAKCYMKSSIYIWEHDRYEESLSYLDSAEQIYRSLNDTMFIAKCHGIRGVYELYEGNNKKAIQYMVEALEVLESIENKSRIVYTNISDNYNNIGMVYKNLQQHRSAIANYKKSIEATLNSKDTFQIELIYSNVGLAYHDLGIADSAFLYYQKALQWDNPNHLGGVYHNIGFTYDLIDSLDRAIEFYKKSYMIRKEILDKRGIALLSNDLAEYYLDQELLEQAKYHIDEGLLYADELNLTESIGSLTKSKSLYYEKIGQFDKALDLYKDFHVIYDSLLNEKNLEVIEKINLEYETEKKDQQIALQEVSIIQEKQLRNFAMVSATFLLLLVVAITLLYRNTNKLKTFEQNFNSKLAHRLANYFKSIRSFIALNQDINSTPAGQLIDRIISNMKRTESFIDLKNNPKRMVDISAMINDCANDVANQYHEKKVKLLFSIDKIYLNGKAALAIGNIVDELVRNSFKYAFTNYHENPIINISLTIDGQSLKLEVSDNGQGFENLSKPKGTGLGRSLVHNSIEELSGKYEINFTNGTSWIIIFDYHKFMDE